MPYVPLDRFLLRAPLLPWSDDRKAGKRLLRDPLGRLALEHASPSLAAHPDGEAAKRAIARYGRRASFRPTPAGLLAGVTVGALGKRTFVATRTPRAHWTLSWARVAGLARALLADPGIRAQVRLRRAPSLLQGEDRIRWLSLGADDGQEHEAELDDRLERLLFTTRKWVPWAAVRHVLARYDEDPDADDGDDEAGGEARGDPPPEAPVLDADDAPADDERDELLLMMIRQGLLHHDLMPPLVGPPALDWMIERLHRLQPHVPEGAALVTIRQALETGDVTRARALVDGLPDARTVDESADADRGDAGDGAQPFVATLIHQAAPMPTLDRRMVEQAAALAPLIFRLQQALAAPVAERLLDAAPGEAIATATELYGEGALDLEALAVGSYGFDLTSTAEPPANSAPPPALMRWLIDEIVRARVDERLEIGIATRTLDSLLPPFTPPATCELFLAPSATRTGWLLGLHAPAGATWGRFAAALGEDLTDALAELNRMEVATRPDQLRLDVAYAPSERLADLCTAPNVRPQMLALSSWPASEDEDGDGDGDGGTDHGQEMTAEVVTPADLMLVNVPGLDEPTLTFAGLASVPSPLTRVRSTTAPAGIYRMLAGASFHRQHGPWAVSLGALADLAFVPRIWVAEFVVSPASWRVPERLDARMLRTWRQGKIGAPPLPRFVQVGDQDELLPVDLDAPDAIRDIQGAPRVWEIWPPVDEPAIDLQGRRLEAVVALVDHPDVATGAANVARAQAIAMAGPVPPPSMVPAAEGWRTFRLYGAETRQNDVLVNAIVPAVHGARDAGEIDGWFFLRYAGERGQRPHLRLRVHSEPDADGDTRAALDAFAARLDDALAAAREVGAVALVESGPYHPEVARFGGPDAMAAAWRLFTLDSELVCRLLRADQEAVDPLDALVVMFDGLTAGLGLSLAERHECARRRRDAEDALAAPRSEDDRRARDADFRVRAPRLRELLSETSSIEELPRLLASYREAVTEAAQELDAAARVRIAAPLLHLTAVRLLGTDREIEAHGYLLWERTLEGLRRSPPPAIKKPTAPDDGNTRLN